jgi:hypothetical protein
VSAFSRFFENLFRHRSQRGKASPPNEQQIIDLRRHDPGNYRASPGYGTAGSGTAAGPGTIGHGPGGYGVGGYDPGGYPRSGLVPPPGPYGPVPPDTLPPPPTAGLPGRVAHRRPHRVWRALGAVLATLLLAQASVAAWVYVTVNRSEITTTRFMDLDRAWAQHPDPASVAGRQLAYQLRRDLTAAETRQLQAELNNPAYQWVSIDEVNGNALKVIVSREDAHLVVRRWMPFNVSDNYERAKRWVDGSGKDSNPSGSTIPQQLAKNLFTNGERSAWRKLWEADLAMAMTLTSDERRILEVYVNVVEFGPGIYGVCAASWYYFEKPPSQLTVMDAATLVGLMPSPKFNTIYPTHPNVQYARRFAADRVAGLETFPADRRAALFEPRNSGQARTCQSRPAGVTARLRTAQTKGGLPEYPGDQSYWARMTRQYIDGTLPKDVLSALSQARKVELARRARVIR